MSKKIEERESEKKVCWSCRHICYSSAIPGHSEETPGLDFALDCNKNHWRFQQYTDTLDDFRRKLETANTCVDFEDRLRPTDGRT